MKIRMKMDVAGTFHGLENVHAGDEVNVDDENGARYCALGYADPVAEPEKDVEKRAPVKATAAASKGKS